jgi:hypothetical protein
VRVPALQAILTCLENRSVWKWHSQGEAYSRRPVQARKKVRKSVRKSVRVWPVVSTDGKGVVYRAGSALVPELADGGEAIADFERTRRVTACIWPKAGAGTPGPHLHRPTPSPTTLDRRKRTSWTRPLPNHQGQGSMAPGTPDLTAAGSPGSRISTSAIDPAVPASLLREDLHQQVDLRPGQSRDIPQAQAHDLTPVHLRPQNVAQALVLGFVTRTNAADR